MRQLVSCCGGGPAAWARLSPDQGRLPSWLKYASMIPHIDRTSNWTDGTVFHNRLLRDGWQPLAEAAGERWEHRQSRQPLTLMFTELDWNARVFGCPHQVEYALRTAAGDVVPLPGVTWADWDQRG